MQPVHSSVTDPEGLSADRAGRACSPSVHDKLLYPRSGILVSHKREVLTEAMMWTSLKNGVLRSQTRKATCCKCDPTDVRCSEWVRPADTKAERCLPEAGGGVGMMVVGVGFFGVMRVFGNRWK